MSKLFNLTNSIKNKNTLLSKKLLRNTNYNNNKEQTINVSQKKNNFHLINNSNRKESKNLELPKFDYEPEKYNGPSFETVEKYRKEYLSPGLLTFYKKPIMVVDGKMQYLFDDKGKRYLDLFAGIVTVSVGHCHPEIVKAGNEQMKKLMHTTNIYYTPEISMFGKELADKLPNNLKVTYFVNSGSEANDLAMVSKLLLFFCCFLLFYTSYTKLKTY
jgi:hypothetical protein